MNKQEITPGYWYIKVYSSQRYDIVSVIKDIETGKLMVFLIDHEGDVPIEEFEFIEKVKEPESLKDPLQELKDAACMAEELFELDELERYADEQRKKKSNKTDI